MFKRLRKLWALSKMDESHLAFTLKVAGELAEKGAYTVEIDGDGKAEFLPDMTEEEFEKHERDEIKGWSKFWGKL